MTKRESRPPEYRTRACFVFWVGLTDFSIEVERLAGF